MKFTIFSVAALVSFAGAAPSPADPFRGQVGSSRADPDARLGMPSSYLGCSYAQINRIREVLSICAMQANTASQKAIEESSTKYRAYFKIEDTSEILYVHSVFKSISAECSNVRNGYGEMRIACWKRKPGTSLADYVYPNGFMRQCSAGKNPVPAYVDNPANTIVLCPEWFNSTIVPAISEKCHKHDQTSVLINEMTRLEQFGHTRDYGAYGYSALFRLTGRQNLEHADSYSLFAQAVSYESRHGLGTC